MITTKQRAKLKAMANKLQPLVNIGKSELTDNILTEIETALYHHELVKVACLKSCETSAKTLSAEVCERLGADGVLCIGNRFVLYKRTDKEGFEHIEI